MLGAGGARQLGIAEHRHRRFEPRRLGQRGQRGGQLRLRRGQPGAHAAERVEHQYATRARPAEPRQPADVRAQERVHLGQRAGQHRGHLARERLPGANRIAVADQHQVRKRPQLARRGERIAAELRARHVELGRGKIEDREIERFVGEPREPFGDRLDLEHEAFAGQRTCDARAFAAVGESNEETFLPAARSVPQSI